MQFLLSLVGWGSKTTSNMSGSDEMFGLVITPMLSASQFIHASLMLGPQERDFLMGWRPHLRNCFQTKVSLPKESSVLYLN